MRDWRDDERENWRSSLVACLTPLKAQQITKKKPKILTDETILIEKAERGMHQQQ